MSLLPEDAHFEELVQDCFLTFRGAGVMLSALDAELVAEWAGQKVPFEVVARGIRRAAERALWDARPNEPALRSLRACRREVTAEIRKYQERSVGTHEAAGEQAEEAPTASEAFELTRHKKLRATLKKFAKSSPAQGPAIQALLDGLLYAAPARLDELARREDAVIACLARTLPWADRVEVTRAVRERMRGNMPQSTRAKALARRLYRAAQVRTKLELPSFW